MRLRKAHPNCLSMPALRIAALLLLSVSLAACQNDDAREMPPPPASVSDPDVTPEPDVYTTPMAPEAVAPPNAGVIVGRITGPDGRSMQDLTLIVDNPRNRDQDGRRRALRASPGATGTGIREVSRSCDPRQRRRRRARRRHDTTRLPDLVSGARWGMILSLSSSVVSCS